MFGIGDVCEAVPFPDLADIQIYEADDLQGRYALAAQIVYGLVVSVYEGYAIVVPITTADVAGDRDQYHALVSAGGSAQWWMRLPALEGAWTADAVALLFLPQTLDEEALADKRMASMHPTARSEVVGEIRLGLRLVTSGCVSVPGPASIPRTTAEDLVGVLAVR